MALAELKAAATRKDLIDETVVAKYREAARVVNEAVGHAVASCLPDAQTHDICTQCDAYVIEHLGKAAIAAAQADGTDAVETGLAFPTSIAVDECHGPMCPDSADSVLLRPGSIVKITVAGHIDGYIALSTITHAVGAFKEPLQGRPADAVCAAHVAAEAIQRQLRPGVTGAEIIRTLKQVTDAFRCNAVIGSFTCNMKRFVLEGEKTIVMRQEAGEDFKDIVIEADEVYCVDVSVSTGEGRLHESETKPSVYQRDVNTHYNLKLKASRELFNEINREHPALPFAFSSLKSKHAKLGLKECVQHGVLVPFPVQTEKRDVVTAQVRFTAIVRADGTLRLTGHPPPWVHSKYQAPAEIQALVSQPASTDGLSAPFSIPASKVQPYV